MSLSPIPRQEIAGDVAIRDGMILMPPVPLLDEIEYWHGLRHQSSQENINTDLVRYLNGMAVQAATDGLEAVRLAVIGGQTIDNPQSEVAKLTKFAIAANAMGRLMRYYVKADEIELMSGDVTQAYTPTQEEKFIMDIDETHLDEAHGIIVATTQLAEEPFMGGVPDLADGQAWYTNHQGLYVSVSTPAVMSPALYDNLILTTGSAQKAEAILNADESVRLQPYLGLAGLAMLL